MNTIAISTINHSEIGVTKQLSYLGGTTLNLLVTMIGPMDWRENIQKTIAKQNDWMGALHLFPFMKVLDGKMRINTWGYMI